MSGGMTGRCCGGAWGCLGGAVGVLRRCLGGWATKGILDPLVQGAAEVPGGMSGICWGCCGGVQAQSSSLPSAAAVHCLCGRDGIAMSEWV